MGRATPPATRSLEFDRAPGLSGRQPRHPWGSPRTAPAREHGASARVNLVLGSLLGASFSFLLSAASSSSSSPFPAAGAASGSGTRGIPFAACLTTGLNLPTESQPGRTGECPPRADSRRTKRSSPSMKVKSKVRMGAVAGLLLCASLSLCGGSWVCNLVSVWEGAGEGQLEPWPGRRGLPASQSPSAIPRNPRGAGNELASPSCRPEPLMRETGVNLTTFGCAAYLGRQPGRQPGSTGNSSPVIIRSSVHSFIHSF